MITFITDQKVASVPNYIIGHILLAAQTDNFPDCIHRLRLNQIVSTASCPECRMIFHGFIDPYVIFAHQLSQLFQHLFSPALITHNSKYLSYNTFLFLKSHLPISSNTFSHNIRCKIPVLPRFPPEYRRQPWFRRHLRLPVPYQ